MMASDPNETERRSGMSKERREVVGTFRHAIGLPLSSIKGMAAIAQKELEKEDSSPDNLRKCSASIIATVDRVSKELQDFSATSPEARNAAGLLMFDLRAPLRNMKGYAEVAQKELETEDFSADALREYLAGITKAVLLADNLLKEHLSNVGNQ